MWHLLEVTVLAQLPVQGATVALRRATAENVSSIVDLLAADQLGATRDGVSTEEDLHRRGQPTRSGTAQPAPPTPRYDRHRPRSGRNSPGRPGDQRAGAAVRRRVPLSLAAASVALAGAAAGPRRVSAGPGCCCPVGRGRWTGCTRPPVPPSG